MSARQELTVKSSFIMGEGVVGEQGSHKFERRQLGCKRRWLSNRALQAI